MVRIPRRQIVMGVPAAAATAALLGVGGPALAAEGYEKARQRIWRQGPLRGLSGAALGRELVRYATLAPSSHNTQCWRFALDGQGVRIRPDLARRCPVVDPDDHHLYVSLGCAAENLLQAAAAFGLRGDAHFDAAQGAVQVTLGSASAPAEAGPLFQAITRRQSTRGDYDGRPLSAAELDQLARAARSPAVDLLLLTERPAMEQVLDFVLQGNSAQLADPAFVAELKAWIRFSESDAVARGDGLFARSSGNPALPDWLGRRLFDFVFTTGSENDKYARQLRSSAGVAVFVATGDAGTDPRARWVAVGRAFERFALQATTLGIRTAHLNMPVEVAAIRPRFAQALGLGAQRPDLVVRFGRGPALPPSLRRPVQAVLD